MAGLIKPPRLRAGQTIGLISPSGPVRDSGTTPETIEAARARLAEHGFETVVGRHAFDAHGYLAGTDADRAADLHAMFRDPDVHGVLCVRGGYGAMRLLEGLDYDLIRGRPKVLIGYSDITALHLALYRRTGLVTFHGPMTGAIAQADAHDLAHLLEAVTRPQALGPLTNPPGAPMIETLVPGIAEGPLVGGNLALVTALLGTSYQPSFEGALLFVEDIVDHAYRLDRKLIQLRLAGALREAAGIVIGECLVRADPSEAALTVREILEDLIVPLGKPAIYGLACGHRTYHLTLPIGVRARLDAGQRVLSIEEAAVV